MSMEGVEAGGSMAEIETGGLWYEERLVVLWQ
jgi:hypothetical protein